MLANFEQREYEGKERAWTGRYFNLHNLPHWHLECELLFIKQGVVTVSHNHNVHTLTKGNAIFIDSSEVHYIKGEPDSIVTILMFDSSIIRELAENKALASPVLKGSYPIEHTCREICRELHEKQDFYALAVCQKVISLMLEIYRTERLADAGKEKSSSSMENYKNLLREIEEKYNYITFEDACSFMHLSGPYFSRFFKNISGMTFSRYLNIIRLEKAIQLLKHNKNDRTITEIASQCGFDTIRHFNRVFKELTGLTPKQLPENYILTSQSVKSRKGNFNPTLPVSRLLPFENPA